MSRWNEWVDLEKNSSYKGCGVYKIRLVDLKDCPIGIPRFLDNDKDGILQIGRSKDIKRRIRSFRGAMEGKEYANVEGKRLNLIKRYTNFMGRYNNFKIQYSFKKLCNKTRGRFFV